MLLTVSIVTYNHTLAQLSSLLNQLTSQCLANQVFIIDNSPIDNLREPIENLGINYFHTGKNLGYGTAHNIAIQKSIQAKVSYHLVLNPDIEIEEHTLSNLAAFMDANQDVGLVMPKIVYQDGSLQYLCKKLPTPFDLFGRRFLFTFIKPLFKKRLNAYELKHKNYNAQMDVPNLSGCFMFMRNEVLNQIGGFDTQYFMYLEDTDLCRRIGAISRTVYYPNVTAIHGYAKDSYKKFNLLKHHIVSAIKYFNKWGWFFDKQRSLKNNTVK